MKNEKVNILDICKEMLFNNNLFSEVLLNYWVITKGHN
jgi:hypothetical protein